MSPLRKHPFVRFEQLWSSPEQFACHGGGQRFCALSELRERARLRGSFQANFTNLLFKSHAYDETGAYTTARVRHALAGYPATHNVNTAD